jgi:hypothetical protein
MGCRGSKLICKPKAKHEKDKERALAARRYESAMGAGSNEEAVAKPESPGSIEKAFGFRQSGWLHTALWLASLHMVSKSSQTPERNISLMVNVTGCRVKKSKDRSRQGRWVLRLLFMLPLLQVSLPHARSK